VLYLSGGEFLIRQENDGAVSPVAGVLNHTVLNAVLDLKISQGSLECRLCSFP